MKNQLLTDCDAVVLTHSDLAGFESKVELFQIVRDKLYSFSSKSGPIGPDHKLLEHISKRYHELLKENPILISRQRELIKRLSARFEDFCGLKDSPDFGLISSELRVLGLIIEELIGVMAPEEVLNHIFSNFCIGK